MFSPFDFENGKDRFLLGWGDYSHDEVSSYGFTGGGVCAFRKFPEYDLTVIFLSNGYKYYPVHNYVVENAAAIVAPEVTNKSGLLKDVILSKFLTTSMVRAKRHYFEVVAKNSEINFESTLNSVGYALMRTNRVKDAMEVFQLNVAEHPNSWNVYDSLGEGYFNNGQFLLAKVNYEKSIALNKENNNAKVMLEMIAKELENP